MTACHVAPWRDDLTGGCLHPEHQGPDARNPRGEDLDDRCGDCWSSQRVSPTTLRCRTCGRTRDHAATRYTGHPPLGGGTTDRGADRHLSGGVKRTAPRGTL